jgi:hypothetical protein
MLSVVKDGIHSDEHDTKYGARSGKEQAKARSV